MSHTILLMQRGARPATRTYYDYQSINECMEAVCKMCENHLIRHNPNVATITYNISQLIDSIDTLGNIGCLVYSQSTKSYAPHNKNWIKRKIFERLDHAARSPNA